MFGKLGFDEILASVRRGEELVVPIGEFGIDGIAGKGKVSAPANFSDFLSVAKRRFRKSNPIAPNQADIVNWILYDRASFAASAVVPALTRLFVSPIGQNTKTKVDTNLTAVSQLEAPQ